MSCIQVTHINIEVNLRSQALNHIVSIYWKWIVSHRAKQTSTNRVMFVSCTVQASLHSVSWTFTFKLRTASAVPEWKLTWHNWKKKWWSLWWETLLMNYFSTSRAWLSPSWTDTAHNSTKTNKTIYNRNGTARFVNS